MANSTEVGRRRSWSTRTVSLAGRKTTVAIEDDYWSALQDIAAARGITISRLCRELDQPGKNLSSALRVYALRYLRDATSDQLPPTPGAYSDRVGRDIDEAVDKLIDARTIGHLEELLQSAVQAIGFEHAAYLMLDSGNRPRVSLVLTSYPEGWRQRYASQHYLSVDPTLSDTNDRLLPFRWSDLRPPDGKPSRVLVEAAAAGLTNGVTAPVHGTGSRQGFLSATVPMSTSEFSRFWATRKNHLLYLAAAVHDTMQRLLETEKVNPRIFKLSDAERTCLRLLSEGRNVADIAASLSCSEQDATSMLIRASRKLGLYDPKQAVLRAEKLHLLSS